MELPSWSDAVRETRKARAHLDRLVAEVTVVRETVEAEHAADTRIAEAEARAEAALIPLEHWRSLTRGITSTPFEEVVAPKHPNVTPIAHTHLLARGFTHTGDAWYVRGVERVDGSREPGGSPLER